MAPQKAAPGRKDAVEFGKSARLHAAARQVTDFMAERDLQLKQSSTREKLDAAQKYAETLSAWTAKINELEAEIRKLLRDDEINLLIVKDWKVHDGSIYYFEHHRMTFQKAVGFCASNHSFLASVEKETEEEYLEAFITSRTVSFWIGLHKREWVWFEDIPVTVTFWAAGRPVAVPPTGPHAPNCVIIANDCTTPKRCWQDTTCLIPRRFSCKRRPNKKFVD